jgi:hypothetical protein
MFKRSLLFAALLAAALTAQAAPSDNAHKPKPTPTPLPTPPPTQIVSLPYTISAPGTYVITSNMTAPITPYGVGAINVATAVPGPVIVDLQGFAITGPGPWQSGGVTVGILIGSDTSGVTNPYPITIRNGTLSNYGLEIETTNANTLNTILSLSNITISNIVFSLPATVPGIGEVAGIWLNKTNSSIFNNCTFSFNGVTPGSTAGIVDIFSTGGNSYNNDTFVNIAIPIVVQSLSVENGQQSGTSHLVLASGLFALPLPPTP